MAARAHKKAVSRSGAKSGSRPQPDHKTMSAKLGSRPAWQGHLRLSLVSCPVALFNATSRSGDISFHMINPETNNRIRMIATDPDTGPVERKDLVKGYEISKNNYIIVTPDELDAVKLETTHTIDIERFVDAKTIDRLFWNDPYFLVPDGAINIEAYTVIRDALESTDRIALARVVMHTRERMLALEPRDNGIVAYTLRMRDEVIEPADAFENIPRGKPDNKMLDIAEKIIEQQEGAFEPGEFKDRYEHALRELIRRKEKGEKIKIAAPEKEESNVIDLMDALKKSLGRKGPAKAAAASRPKTKSKAASRKRS